MPCQQVCKPKKFYSELRKYFHKEHSKVTWEEVLKIKSDLQVHAFSNPDDTFHGRNRTAENDESLIPTVKVTESEGDLTCCVSSLEDAVSHSETSVLIEILTNEI